MVRILLVLLIMSVWVTLLVTNRLLPNISAVVLIVSLLLAYSVLISVAMLHQKRKRQKNLAAGAITGPVFSETVYCPKISVIVPAHNEASVIAETVHRLMRLDYPALEVCVVDDRSADETAAILAELQQAYAQHTTQLFAYSRSPEAMPGKSAVLNEALTKTTGEVLCVFDADAQFAPDFLKQMLPFLADENVGAVQARKVIGNAETNWLTLCQNYEYSLDSHFQCGRDSIRGAVELRGNGQLVKRSALASVGGWNNETLTDDLDLSTKLHIAGWDIRFAHKVLVYEEGIPRIPPLLRQRRRWAKGSIIRYLEHPMQVLNSNKVSLRTKADLIAYIVEFLIPLWMVTDYLILAWQLWGEPPPALIPGMTSGGPTRGHLISSLVMLPVLSVFFTIALLVAIIRFNRPPLLQAVWGAVLTGTYMFLLWMPIVFFTMGEILFRPKKALTKWGKTEHFGLSSAVLDSAPEGV